MTTWDKTSWRPEGHSGAYMASYVLCPKCNVPTDIILEQADQQGDYDYWRWCPSCGEKIGRAGSSSLVQKEGKGEPFTYGDPTYSPP